MPSLACSRAPAGVLYLTQDGIWDLQMRLTLQGYRSNILMIQLCRLLNFVPLTPLK